MLLGRSLIRRFILNNAEIRVQWGVAKAQWASNRCLLRLSAAPIQESVLPRPTVGHLDLPDAITDHTQTN